MNHKCLILIHVLYRVQQTAPGTGIPLLILQGSADFLLHVVLGPAECLMCHHTLLESLSHFAGIYVSKVQMSAVPIYSGAHILSL